MSVRHCVRAIKDNARKCTVRRLIAKCDFSGEDQGEIRKNEQRHGEKQIQ